MPFNLAKAPTHHVTQKEEGTTVKIIYNDGHVAECPEEEELEVLRHSAAHIMAQAV